MVFVPNNILHLLHRRAIVYAIVIGIPAALIVGTALHASYSDRQTIIRLQRLWLQLSAERLADEIEQAVFDQAETCLRELDTSSSQLTSCATVSAIYYLQGTKLIAPATADGLSRRLMEELSVPSRFIPGRMYPLAYNTRPYAQIFYMRRRGSARVPQIIAVSLDLEKFHYETWGFPGYQKRSGLDASLIQATNYATGGNIIVFFRSVFPFWRISVNEAKQPVAPHILVGIALVLAAAVLLCVSTSSLARHANDRETFLTAATHALKLPLANVRLYAELLKAKHSIHAESAFQFDTIIHETDSLSRRIDRVLAATQMAISGWHYDRRPTNLVEVVRSTLDSCRDWIRHSGFQMCENLPGESVGCLIDPVAVSSALIDLLENAVKYSCSSPAVIIVRVGTEKERAVLEVTDLGNGIPLREQAHIFDRFRRGSGGAEKGGFGLGLFLVRHMATHHGGSVRLHSEPGAGSTFQLLFPLCKLF